MAVSEQDIENLRISTRCMICFNNPIGRMRLTKCCSAVLCMDCAESILVNEHAFSKMCPHCNSPNFSPSGSTIKMPAFVKDLQDTLEKLQMSVTAPGRPVPPLGFHVRGDILDFLFDQFNQNLRDRGTVQLSASDVAWLSVFGVLFGNHRIEGLHREDAERLGTDFYRVLCTQKWSFEQISKLSEFLCDFGADKWFIRNCALPAKFVRPVHLIKEGMTRAEEQAAIVEYVYAWAKPFQRANKVCEELFTAFGLNQLAARCQNKLPDKWGHCANLLCGIKFEVRNEIHHIQQMEKEVPYTLQCRECGEEIQWDLMPQHYAYSHENSRYKSCTRCDYPLEGTLPPKVWHEIECPLRSCPLSISLRASAGRITPPPIKNPLRELPSLPLFSFALFSVTRSGTGAAEVIGFSKAA